MLAFQTEGDERKRNFISCRARKEKNRQEKKRTMAVVCCVLLLRHMSYCDLDAIVELDRKSVV